MDILRKLIMQMYHAADSKIPALSEQFFSHLADICQECAAIKDLQQSIPCDCNMWEIILNRIISISNLSYGENWKNIQTNVRLKQLINEFEKEAIRRQKNINEVCTILEAASIPYYLNLTNINSNTATTIIKQFWTKIDTLGNGKLVTKRNFFNFKSGNISKDIIEKELKLLSLHISLIIDGGNIEQGRDLTYEFDAIKAALSQYHRNKEAKIIAGKTGLSLSKMFALHDFEYCSLCWRFVPKKSQGDSRKAFCGIHTYDPSSSASQTEYIRALKFNHNKSNYDNSGKTPPPLPGTATQIYKLLQKYFPINNGGISRQKWLDALSSKLSRLNLSLFPNVEYNLASLWRVCPNVHRYIIEQNGDDKSPESILEKLDPETPNEAEEFRIERNCLHKLFSKNLALYRLELALAESYLSEYYQYRDTHPHGGKRPGAGGKRNGSGRKPKSR